jgi:DNA polymerase
MFIGEAPGGVEDRRGIPFVGPAGKIFDSMLTSVNLRREDVYVTNVVKCRPPNNRNPTEDEISACRIHLDKELDEIKPNVIVPMGNFATRYILGKYGIKFKSISSVHGKVFKVNKIIIYPLYHPAALIYDSKLKSVMDDDIKKVKNLNDSVEKLIKMSIDNNIDVWI